LWIADYKEKDLPRRRDACVRTITIIAHAGVVTGLAGLFFGILAWANHSPYGLPMSFGSLVLLALSGAVGRYYGFSPMWQPHGWEEQVAQGGQRFVVSTQQYPPYLALRARRHGGAQFGTAVYPLSGGEEVAEDVQALYGMQWRARTDAEEGHRWVVQVLREGKQEELEDFRARPEPA
jgi:hypothetical protein